MSSNSAIRKSERNLALGKQNGITKVYSKTTKNINRQTSSASREKL
jgi:hypothetical protein